MAYTVLLQVCCRLEPFNTYLERFPWNFYAGLVNEYKQTAFPVFSSFTPRASYYALAAKQIHRRMPQANHLLLPHKKMESVTRTF